MSKDGTRHRLAVPTRQGRPPSALAAELVRLKPRRHCRDATGPSAPHAGDLDHSDCDGDTRTLSGPARPNLGRPGRNVTGVTILLEEMSAKRATALKEAVPSVSRVAVLWIPLFHGTRPC